MTADVAPPIVRSVDAEDNPVKPHLITSDLLPARVASPEVVTDATAPHIGTPGEADWQKYQLSKDMFPGGAATALAIARDSCHVEYNGQLNDSWIGGLFSGYNTNVSGCDVKTEDGRLIKREVSFNYQDKVLQ